jgi:exodeoxyribonuclease V alpha subunit
MSTTTITGILERIRFSSANYFTVADLRLPDATTLCVVGKLLQIKTGDTVELKGSYVQDPRFGKQFKIDQARAVIPSGDEGATRLLARLPFVGQGRAEKLVRHFGAAEVFAILESESRWPELSAVEPLLNEARLQILGKAWQEQNVERSNIDALGKLGLDDNRVSQLLQRFGSKALEALHKNPFVLLEIRGMTYPEADNVAQALGFASTHKVRLRGAMLSILIDEELAGHTWLDANNLALKASHLLQVNWDRSREVLDDILQDGDLLENSGDDRIHLQDLFHAERQILQWVS